MMKNVNPREMTAVIAATAVAVLGSMLLSVPPQAEERVKSQDQMAMDILRKADAAVKAVRSVQLKATTTPSGVAVSFWPGAEGEAIMVGWDGNRPERFWADVTTQRDGEAVRLTGGGNGDSYFLIDHKTRKGYEDMDPAVMGRTGRPLSNFGMLEFVHDAPFDDELSADTVEVLGVEDVNDEKCHHLRVVYSGGRGESEWFFSMDDYMPRRRIRKFSTPRGEGSVDIVITSLKLNPRIDPNKFLMQLPRGFEQIDDFAP